MPRLVLSALFPLAALTLSAAAQQPASLTGTWSIAFDYHGTPSYWALHLTDTGGKLTGDLDGDKLEGKLDRGHVTFHAIDPRGGYEDVDATVSAGKMTGKVTWKEVGSDEIGTYDFTAVLPQPHTGPPQRHEFVPTEFHRQFSAQTPPVMHIFPGDTLHTTTVDAGGFDEHGKHRSTGGNPETGPFYVEGALPGDTLVVHLVHLKLNRDTAISDDGVVPRATSNHMVIEGKDLGDQVTWKLDREKGVATSTKPGDHLKPYTVPMKPMLGCIATAPPAWQAIPTGDSGPWGGNMDFNEVVEGNTVYLPVINPGALLYIGDGHAAQGDGELNGNALETSMDVEITVDLIHGHGPNSPRVVSPEKIMAMGLGGSLEDALKAATDNMSRWLAEDYHLKPSEIAQVLGTAAEYHISEVADRNAGIVIELRKDRLATIDKDAPETKKPEAK
ncbi:Acetamidase/formamidase [Bryocella elongata]|uniref:Acetamidase/formamidase n=1 Tax=Bryocella elongata TaxID=863522 RepID=A0A1H5UMZ3_9BACT|nr:acetamidase/formamidase family protein [Bryocella elongata]SEF75577.1 Acetamidase/formamidase [Bryocella elongata]